MILQQGSASFEKAQSVSKALLGNQDRLLAGAAIADSESGSIFGRSLAEQIGIGDQRVGLQLKAFLTAGLLVRLPKIGGEQRVYYERVESVFWDLCSKLVEEIAERDSA